MSKSLLLLIKREQCIRTGARKDNKYRTQNKELHKLKKTTGDEGIFIEIISTQKHLNTGLNGVRETFHYPLSDAQC